MYKTNLLRAHRYLNTQNDSIFDLTLAELLIIEQIANGHKWMSEIKHNCGISEWTCSKAVSRLSTGYHSGKGLDILSKHSEGRYKFMSFTPKGLKLRDGIMDYYQKRIEKKDGEKDVEISQRILKFKIKKFETEITKLKGELNG